MFVRTLNLLFFIGFVACLGVGCATTREVKVDPVVSGAIPRLPESSSTAVETERPKTLQISEISSFAQRVEWPEMPNTGASSVYRIESGIADNVWVEGKGYFKGTLEEIYQDLTDAMVIGPTHLTQKIERDEFVETDLKTSFVMHVKMKYVFNIEFDLSAQLEPIFDGDNQVGWLYQSDKTSGTRFIKMISDTIVIRALENGWFSVEMLSVNQATKDKEEEARGHMETLFAYWEKASETRS